MDRRVASLFRAGISLACYLLHAGFLWFILRPWRLLECAALKSRLISNGLYGSIGQDHGGRSIRCLDRNSWAVRCWLEQPTLPWLNECLNIRLWTVKKLYVPYIPQNIHFSFEVSSRPFSVNFSYFLHVLRSAKLGSVIPIILCEQYKSWSHSMLRFVHYSLSILSHIWLIHFIPLGERLSLKHKQIIDTNIKSNSNCQISEYLEWERKLLYLHTMAFNWMTAAERHLMVRVFASDCRS